MVVLQSQQRLRWQARDQPQVKRHGMFSFDNIGDGKKQIARYNIIYICKIPKGARKLSLRTFT